jgi:hypothetical protein
MPHDPKLAYLCFVKGNGWADRKLWDDPRFRDLPVRLDDMLDKVVVALRQNSDLATADLQDSLAALKAIRNNLDRFENISPVLAALLKQPYNVSERHAATHRPAQDGYALEFVGYGQYSEITIEHLQSLPREERRAIAASDEAMDKLMPQWNKIVRKGRLSKKDNAKLLDISSQMGDRLILIFDVVETALGGPLQDHYAAQRAIADFARRYKVSDATRADADALARHVP